MANLANLWTLAKLSRMPLPGVVGGVSLLVAAPFLIPAVRRGAFEGLRAAAAKAGAIRGRLAPEDGLACNGLKECTADTLG
jgi:hypothetical protein